MRILVTGANGFIGRALEREFLLFSEYDVIPVVRHNIDGFRPAKQVGDIDGSTQWASILDGVDVIVHTAATVTAHKYSDSSPISEFRRVNVEGTLNLARQAVRAGVNRFVFISSIKVNGENTLPNQPFLPEDKPNPIDAYGTSKLEAELALIKLAEESGLEVVIIRPCLVYGSGVKGNFLSMMRCVNSGIPLPLGVIDNKRSMISIENLVELVIICIDHPNAVNQIFLASDGEDISTTELLQRLGKALDKPARLIPIPVSLLTFIAALLGKKSIAQRLCGSLQVDISKAREMLGWEPLIMVNEGLRRTVEGFKK
ncbi:MAG: hypothetical protein COA46_00725 [Porticoccaceae bacterium]|nr:MAG: hypothetical protein COA46_00725 [Porticoccaceae bacterium]